tara:strand:- start:227 stop:439 length:213 start_codon:yes stop_codon:yes gene_type:complete
MKTKLKLKKSKKSEKPVDKLAIAAKLGLDLLVRKAEPPYLEVVIHDEIERRAAEAGFSDEVLEYKYGRNV